MLAGLVVLLGLVAPGGQAASRGRTRTYYIAADEVRWDYALVEGEDPNACVPTLRQGRRVPIRRGLQLPALRFCGEDLDAADLRLQEDIDRIAHGLLPTSWEELLPPLEAEFV